MKNGYYLSIYAHIDALAHIMKIDLRHDQHMALWEKCEDEIRLVHYWEFERLSGLKHHNQSFYDVDHAKKVINRLLSQYHLTLNDIAGVFGTPGLDNISSYHSMDLYPQFAYHSMAHLFSCLFMDSEVFYHQDIIALAVDGAPDNVVDFHARDKDFYLGAFSRKGNVSLSSIPSPGLLWMLMKLRYKMQEGSLMALSSASDTTCLIPLEHWLSDFYPIRKASDILHASSWFAKMAEKIESIEDEDINILFTDWDARFSKRENIISMVAKAIQEISIHVMDLTIQEFIEKYHVDTTKTYLAISGGFSLNCPTNTFLMNKYKFKGLLVPPCVSDTGIALGMGLYAFYQKMDSIHFKLHHAYYGDSNTTDIKSVENGRFKQFIEEVSPFQLDMVVNDIQTSPIVWVSGHAEIGPRALGARSILADPSKEGHKDLLNHIKLREWWRPVAPIILKGHTAEWFVEDSAATPYMLTTMHIKESKKPKVPAILHLDDTARVQELEQAHNPMLYSVLKAFSQKTGIPILCNTSLNDKGEPIINRYDEVLNFALRKHIHIVYLDGYRIVLRNFEAFADIQPQKRDEVFEFFQTESDKQRQRRELNPFDLSEEELIFYYNSPELKSYSLTNEKDVNSIRRIMNKFKDKNLTQIDLLTTW